MCGCQWRRLSSQSTAFEKGCGLAVLPRVLVSVEAAVLSVESTVDRLRPRLSVSVEAAVFVVGGIRERLWIGIAATSVGASGGSGAVSRVDSGSAAPLVWVAVEAAVLSVDGI